jgi:hypothetical protein
MSKARDIADLVSAGNILADGAIATTEITGVTATSAELNTLDGVTATASELNALDGITVTATELNYNDITTLGTAQASKVLTTDSNTSVKFGDGVFASNNNAVIMGASDDLRVYHDSGTGRSTLHSAPNFDIFSDNAVYIKKGDPSSSDMLIATGGAASSVLLYYSGSQKLATTSTGIDVTGTADMDTLSIGGTAVTSTAAELNILDGVTSTAAELNILDGVTSTTAELNILDGVTATTAELNILDGVTATTTELNYVDGVTSNIQTQIDGIGGGAAFTAF